MALLSDRELTVANVGDSRGVLCDKDGNAVALSHDHKPYQLKERKRIKRAGMCGDTQTEASLASLLLHHALNSAFSMRLGISAALEMQVQCFILDLYFWSSSILNTNGLLGLPHVLKATKRTKLSQGMFSLTWEKKSVIALCDVTKSPLNSEWTVLFSEDYCISLDRKGIFHK